MALKPIPKAILIVAVVAGAGYSAMKFLPDSKPAPTTPTTEAPTPATTVVTPPTTQEQAEAKAPPTPIAEAPTPAQAPADDGLRATGGHDAGLDAVLKAGKR